MKYITLVTGARRHAVAFGIMIATSGFGLTSHAQQLTSEDFGAALNAALEAAGYPYRLAKAELYTMEGEGRTLGFMDTGNKQTGARFVPRDPFRVWSGDQSDPDDNITWASELLNGDLGPGPGESQGAIARAMQTWDDVWFTDLSLTQYPVPADLDLGFTEWAIDVQVFGTAPADAAGLGGPWADVTHCGNSTVVDSFLNLVAGPDASRILAVTFYWTVGELISPDPYLDRDGDGNADLAFTEVYYTKNFTWGIDAELPAEYEFRPLTDEERALVAIDLETVALHETGHALGQDHFGSAFRAPNGTLRRSPWAVMNGGYSGLLQQLTGSDLAGHASIWGTWPVR